MNTRLGCGPQNTERLSKESISNPLFSVGIPLPKTSEPPTRQRAIMEDRRPIAEIDRNARFGVTALTAASRRNSYA